MSTRGTARKIVDSIIGDLWGRRGIDNEFDQIDEDVMAEIVESLTDKTVEILEDEA